MSETNTTTKSPPAPAGLTRTGPGRKLWRDVVTSGKYVLRPDELRILEDACHQSDRIDNNAKHSVGVNLDEGRDNGRFEGTDYAWSLDIAKMDPPPSSTGVQEEVPVDLYRLELDVMWREGRDERHAKFTTMRAIQPGGAP